MGWALKQTALISILSKNSPDSNQKGKKNKHSVVNSYHYVCISATNSGVPSTYLTVCRAVGTLNESNTAPAPRLLGDTHGTPSHEPEGCAEQGMIFPVNRAPGLSLRTTPSSWEERIPISQTAKQRAKEQPLWEAAESGLEQHRL